MTPEQRAREIIDRNMKPVPGSRIHIVMADPMPMFEEVADAIRIAENDAIDRAAAVVLADLSDDLGPEVAALVRELKHV